MFIVFNKEKITAYIVSILTVCFLFFVANSVPEKEKAEPTSVNIQKDNSTINNKNMNNTVLHGNTNNNN